MDEFIKLGNFQTGRAIKAAYTNPSDGRVRIDLINDKGDIVLHFNPRFDQKEVVIATQIDGKWPYQLGEKPQKADGYDFEAKKDVTVTFIAKDGYIQILLGDKQFYDYKTKVPVTSITTAKFEWFMGSGIPPVLKYLGVIFSLAE